MWGSTPEAPPPMETSAGLPNLLQEQAPPTPMARTTRPVSMEAQASTYWSDSDSGSEDPMEDDMVRVGDVGLESVLASVMSVQPTMQLLIQQCQRLEHTPGPERDAALSALQRLVQAQMAVQHQAQQLLDQNRAAWAAQCKAERVFNLPSQTPRFEDWCRSVANNMIRIPYLAIFMTRLAAPLPFTQHSVVVRFVGDVGMQSLQGGCLVMERFDGPEQEGKVYDRLTVLTDEEYNELAQQQQGLANKCRDFELPKPDENRAVRLGEILQLFKNAHQRHMYNKDNTVNDAEAFAKGLGKHIGEVVAHNAPTEQPLGMLSMQMEGLHVRSESWDAVDGVREITTDGYRLEHVTITCRPGGCLKISARDVQLINVIVRGAPQSPPVDTALISVGSGASLSLAGCRVEDSAGVGVDVSGQLTAISGTVIIGSRLANLLVRDGGSVSMQDAHLQNSVAGCGVQVADRGSFTATRNTHIISNAVHGLWVQGGGQATTGQSTSIKNNRARGVVVDGGGTYTGSSTTISDNNEHNLSVRDPHSTVTLTSCTLQDARWYGVSVENGGTFSASSTAISGNIEHNMQVSDAGSTATLSNCQVLSSTLGCGVLVTCRGKLHASDVLLQWNHLSNVEVQDHSEAVLHACKLNFSKAGRGALVHKYGTLHLNDVTFEGNPFNLAKKWHQCKYDWGHSNLYVNGVRRGLLNPFLE